MILFLNNFKGFSKTFIPFGAVNFLVGENSTGKSTVLSVLEMLSKSSYWYTPQLNSGEYRFGPFQEIVNQISFDQSFFQVGVEFVFHNTLKPKSQPSLFRILETFKEREGSIILDSLQYMYEGDTYYCSHLADKKISISRRTRRYGSFKSWIDSGEPNRRKDLEVDLGTSLWMPFLMKVVQNFYHKDDDSGYLFLFPRELSNFTIISPIRAEAHRIYESFSQSYSPQGEHIPVVLNHLMHSNSVENKNILKRLYRFGRNSNLFDSISVPRYGNTSDSPFTIAVEYGKIKANLTNVGYGVTQSLPLLVELLKSNGRAFSIQQPEVHLHPKAQASFGELMYESASSDNNTFFCETHSDFIINRYRYAMNKGEKKVDSQVLFFTRDDKGTHVVPIKIDEKGHYIDVPDEYMSFFIDEELKMLEF